MSNLVGVAALKTTERVLDWFHISMRLRPIEQMSSKIAIVAGDSDIELKQLLAEKLPLHPISALERQKPRCVGAYRQDLLRYQAIAGQWV